MDNTVETCVNTHTVEGKIATAINVPEGELLTPYNDEFIIHDLKEGDDVKIGAELRAHYYLRCDFSSFDEKLKDINPEGLEKAFIVADKLEKFLPSFDEDTRRIVHSCWRATRIARRILGEVANEENRNNSFIKYKIDGTNFCTKPLSKCVGESVCTEYALITKHILKKLNIKSSVIVGAFNNNPNTNTGCDRHTFLVLEEGNLVFDPTHSALKDGCWPPVVLAPEKPLITKNLVDMSTEGADFGHRISCKDLATNEVKMYGSGAG